MDKTNSDKRNVSASKNLILLRLYLLTVGAWPSDHFKERQPLFSMIQRNTLSFQSFIVFCGNVYCIVHNFHQLDFLMLGHMYLTAFLALVTSVRLLLTRFPKYGELLRNFIMTFHLMHFKKRNDDFYKMFKKIDRFSNFYTILTIIVMLISLTLFNLCPMYATVKKGYFTNDQKNITPEFSLYYEFPGFNPFEHFYLCTVINFYCSFNCACIVCVLDLLIYLMIFQIIGHIIVLKNNLYNFPKPKNQMTVNGVNNQIIIATVDIYDNEENMYIHKKLVECVDHYRLIVGFTNDLSKFFGFALAFNYLFHLVSCCVLLMECSTGDTEALIRYGPLTLIIFGQLIQMSVVFEVIGSESEKLVDAACHIPWYCMNISNRRIVCFMLSRLQTPINVKALGLTAVGVQTMAGILKTTFSYFAFLQSLNK